VVCGQTDRYIITQFFVLVNTLFHFSLGKGDRRLTYPERVRSIIRNEKSALAGAIHVILVSNLFGDAVATPFDDFYHRS